MIGAAARFQREGQTYYQCRVCRHQTTLLAGTLFEATKLPLTTWFLALHLLTASKTNVAALELKRHLGVTYRTAWRLKHKIMQAMTQREESRRLKGLVQIDDAYLGGERNGGKPGRGSENKQPFLIAVETNENLDHPACAVIEPVRTFDNVAVADWCARRLAPEAEVYTDGLSAFRRFADAGHAHRYPRRRRTRGHRRTRCALGQHRALQRQAIHRRQLPRHPSGQVRPPLPR